MAVYQVDEYYISMINLDITEHQKESIMDFLGNEGFSDYEFQDDNTSLIIDGLDSEGCGENLERAIRKLI